MTTPPIEDFSNSLSSIGGAYQMGALYTLLGFIVAFLPRTLYLL